MFLRTLVVGAFGANCFIIGCEETKVGAVIDPGGEGPRILSEVDKSGLDIQMIINTHGHIDHIAANAEVKSATDAEIVVHELDAPMLSNPARSLALLTPITVSSVVPDRLVRGGEELVIGNVRLQVLHTPGHTPGGITLVGDKVAFTGDTLFAGSIGRTDFPGGSYEQIIDSIVTVILPLGDDVTVYPGHGPASTVGEERMRNPFLGDARV